MQATNVDPSKRRPLRGAAEGASALTLAGIAALLASGCCVLPLVFVLVGISGAWISQLHRLEPYSAWLVALALGSLALAGWRLFRPSATAAASCLDASCSQANAAARRWFWAVAVMTVIPVLVPLAAPLLY